jgi:hypothetical protein
MGGCNIAPAVRVLGIALPAVRMPALPPRRRSAELAELAGKRHGLAKITMFGHGFDMY